MKWFLLSVAVFAGSMVLFAAIPRSALIWARNVVVQPLEIADESRTASGPATGSTRSADDGVYPIETRRRETIQADVAGRARVIDGDTIEVGSVRIRLFGLDAPESTQSCLEGSRRWPCGEQATRALVGRIEGRSVTCEERDRDRYGRIVAVCRYGAQDVNAWLVREGWAVAYRRYSSAYAGEEASARGSSASESARSSRAGWPRAVAHPRLPQIRTCPIKASGSSNNGLAAQRYTLCTTLAKGRG